MSVDMTFGLEASPPAEKARCVAVLVQALCTSLFVCKAQHRHDFIRLCSQLAWLARISSIGQCSRRYLYNLLPHRLTFRL